jgi:hypothetical protein
VARCIEPKEIPNNPRLFRFDKQPSVEAMWLAVYRWHENIRVIGAPTPALLEFMAGVDPAVTVAVHAARMLPELRVRVARNNPELTAALLLTDSEIELAYRGNPDVLAHIAEPSIRLQWYVARHNPQHILRLQQVSPAIVTHVISEHPRLITKLNNPPGEAETEAAIQGHMRAGYNPQAIRVALCRRPEVFRVLATRYVLDAETQRVAVLMNSPNIEYASPDVQRQMIRENSSLREYLPHTCRCAIM